VRIKVWNDPYDSDGNGYGGGNNDLKKAVTIGQLATNAGMRVLIDFHYSDFWADPDKQKAPKAWSDYSIEERAAAITTFTTESLNTLLDADVDVGMVQIGNETNGKFCGTSDWEEMCTLFNAGSSAVRAISEDIKVVLHFANPDTSGRYAGYAANLKKYDVDYDVFASSYYPYWHGSVSKLKSVLSTIADTYEKEVMVAETAWLYTYEDGDGHENTITEGKSGVDLSAYTVSLQGMANEIRDVCNAIASIDNGIGVFYWEPAWIPVQVYEGTDEEKAEILAENKDIWEANGSGWASSYAGDYDSSAAEWYGGSAIDNQAWFDFEGNPLEILKIYNYIRTGAVAYKAVDTVSLASTSTEIYLGDDLTIPETANVIYNDSTTEAVKVVWDTDELKAVTDANAAENVTSIKTYTISGTVTVDDEEYPVTYKVTIKPENLIENPGFENGNKVWSLTTNPSGAAGIKQEANNLRSGSWCLHFWANEAFTYELTQEVTLEPGVYVLGSYFQGGSTQNGDTFELYATAPGGKEFTVSTATNGHQNWDNPEVKIELKEAVTLTVGVKASASAGAWGSWDDFYLYKSGDVTVGADEEVHEGGEATCAAKAVCEVCGKEYGEEDPDNHTGETEIVDKVAATCTEAGYEEKTVCKGCDAVIDGGEEIEATGHTGGEATCAAKAVCEVCGKEYGEEDPDNHTGETEIVDKVAATCTEAGYTGDTKCLDCEEIIKKGTETKATGHTGGEATCVEQAVCTTCGQKYGEVDSSNHAGDTELVNAKDATCTETGYTGDTKCLDCEEIIKEGTEIKVTAHKTKTVDAVAATCTEVGYTEKTVCETCGEVIEGGEKIPATGHSYKAETTKEATTKEEGQIAYTCENCDDSYTETIPMLDFAPPYIEGDEENQGWDVIREETSEAIKESIANANEEETVNVVMNGADVVPGDIFDMIKGKNVTIVFDMGDGIKWTVDGMTVTEDKIDDINLRVHTGDDANPISAALMADVINNVTGEMYTMNLTLEHEGEFGFTAVMSIGLEEENAGFYANLFYNNTTKNKLEFICVDKIAKDGTANLTFTHASDYVIVIDNESLDPNEETSDEEPGTSEEIKPDTPEDETKPDTSEEETKTEVPADNTTTQTGAVTEPSTDATTTAPSTDATTAVPSTDATTAVPSTDATVTTPSAVTPSATVTGNQTTSSTAATTAAPATTTAPKTGDDTKAPIAVLLLLVSEICIAGCLMLRRKRS
jgi:arabinogalactan endo-1,4-beta-galactosidase